MVLGIVVIALFLLGFGLWADRAGQRAAAGAAEPPELSLWQPTDGELVRGAVSLVFSTPAELRYSRAGWGSGGFHVHAEVNGVEVMPGIDDFARLPDNRYRWVIGPLAPGTHELRLFWSDRRHREVEGTGSPTIRVVVLAE